MLLALLCCGVLAEKVIDAEFVKWSDDRREVTVKRDDGRETSYKLSTGCQFWVDGKEVKADDKRFKAKTPLRIIYDTDGAELIRVTAFDKIDRPPYRGKR